MNSEEFKYKNIYFLGIGGIGMSALARFFHKMNKQVAGYDRVETPLTHALEAEGIAIHYTDDISNIELEYLFPEQTLVVYTPAIPKDHLEWNYFQKNDFKILKRAEVLGLISKASKTLAVAGTHGKTTISTMTAHLLNSSKLKASGFLGGISNNFNSNLVLSDSSDLVVTEADEFDRSFLHLYPHKALISSMDADHLDIYGEKEQLQNSFFQFIHQIEEGGVLVQKLGLPYPERNDITRYTYGVDNTEADFYAQNIQLEVDTYTFDLQTPLGVFANLKLGVPGLVNLENAIGASALALLSGIQYEELQEGLKTYLGVKRRFDYRIKKNNFIYIDDYAHHPEELKAFISSVRAIYPNRKISGIFQPHLYSRTQDFADEFAKSLSLLDELFLLDIYPARELPIEGVTSQIIFDKVEIDAKQLCRKENIIDILEKKEFEILLTLGAGDIDQLVPQIELLFK